jgi:hypothetical protein
MVVLRAGRVTRVSAILLALQKLSFWWSCAPRMNTAQMTVAEETA